MTQKEIMKKLKNIIAPYLDKPCEINMEMDLSKDLAVNSVDLLNIIMEMEDEFKCKMSDDQMLNIRLVKDIVDYIINLEDTQI